MKLSFSSRVAYVLYDTDSHIAFLSFFSLTSKRFLLTVDFRTLFNSKMYQIAFGRPPEELTTLAQGRGGIHGNERKKEKGE